MCYFKFVAQRKKGKWLFTAKNKKLHWCWWSFLTLTQAFEAARAEVDVIENQLLFVNTSGTTAAATCVETVQRERQWNECWFEVTLPHLENRSLNNIFALHPRFSLPRGVVSAANAPWKYEHAWNNFRWERSGGRPLRNMLLSWRQDCRPSLSHWSIQLWTESTKSSVKSSLPLWRIN